MTSPLAEFEFQQVPGNGGSALVAGPPDPLPPEPKAPSAYPDPLLELSQEVKDDIARYLDQWINELDIAVEKKRQDWADQEDAYRALPMASKSFPFKGAANEVIPVVAMAVDPVHARLDTGIFKQDPVFTVKMLKKKYAKYKDTLQRWIDFYIKNILKLRAVASPRLLECTKLGTAAFKTVYQREECIVQTYDENFKVVKQKQVKFAGPKVLGISMGDLLFPPGYQHMQDCPIVIERQRTTYNVLLEAEQSGRLKNVEKIKDQVDPSKTKVEEAREKASNHQINPHVMDNLIVWEPWFYFDVNGDGYPEKLVATYHRETRTFLQLRYNWYFHQRFPYTLIPYTITNDSLYGLGIAEMVMPFQVAITRFHQMSSDNAYLANIRMFITKKNSGFEDVPRLYAGRCFPVDDPTKDFIPFAVSDIYPSTLTERQNLFGMVEKRTGVSDYLTGRESPIVGSRATATSTLALIQEGTKRVEEVLENLRNGFSEIIENCLYIWIQYGLGDAAELAFGDDEEYQLLQEFFSTIRKENVNGAMAVQLTATDAAGNRQAQQQMQLAIIQIMMQYLEKVLAAGQAALQAQMVQPQLTEMIKEVMTAARNMFKDLLTKYDIVNPEDYLPDLEKYLNGPGIGPAVGAGLEGRVGGPEAVPGVPPMAPAPRGPAIPVPAQPGSGGRPAPNGAAAGAGSGY